MSCPQGYDRATIFIKPIAHGATVEELQLFYEQYGDILSINIPADRVTHKCKGYAFIDTFLHPDDAATARDRTNGSNLLGKLITVEIAEGPRKTPAEMQHRREKLRRFQERDQLQHGRFHHQPHQHRPQRSFKEFNDRRQETRVGSYNHGPRAISKRRNSTFSGWGSGRGRRIEPIIQVSPSTSPSISGSRRSRSRCKSNPRERIEPSSSSHRRRWKSRSSSSAGSERRSRSSSSGGADGSSRVSSRNSRP